MRLQETLEQAKLINTDRDQVIGECAGGGGGGQRAGGKPTTKGHKGTPGVMKMLSVLTVMMVAWVCTFVKVQ